MNKDVKVHSKMEPFRAGQTIQPQTIQHFQELGYDFVYDGFRYEGVSESLLEIH